MKKLAVIIVNWNSVSHLRKCLRSIFSNTVGLDFEVIVVDNASYDGCAEMLISEFPAVKSIQSGRNLGFAAANNLGYGHSTAEKLLFLNPDTEIVGDAIGVMMEKLDTLPEVGAVGCKILNSDGSNQITAVQSFPTILNQFFGTDYLILRFPKLRMWGVRPLFFYSGTPEKVEVISGACVMTKRDVFEKVGGFSKDYFMYGEDLDLCWKIQRAGYKIYYVGDASIVHHGGTSTSRAENKHLNTVVKRESVAIFFRKYQGKRTAFLYRVSTGFASVIRLGIIVLILPIGVTCQRQDSIRVAFEKWVKVLRWSLGLEKWAGRLGEAKG